MLGLQHGSDGKFFAISLSQDRIDDEKFSLKDIVDALEEGEAVKIKGLDKHLTMFYRLDGKIMFAILSRVNEEILEEQELNREKLSLLESQFAEWMAVKQTSETELRVVFLYEFL